VRGSSEGPEGQSGRYFSEMAESSSAGTTERRSDLPPDSSLAQVDIERLCLRNLAASSEERVFFKDLDSRFALVSAGFAEALGGGSSAADLVGKTDFDLFTSPHATEAFEDEQQIIRTGEAIVGKIERETFEDRPDKWVATTKLPLRDDRGEIVGTWGISRDVTEEVEARRALTRQVLRDPITGVANRIALMDRLAQALLALERQSGSLAVVFVDLDNFKTINDSFGHDVGDQVIATVARRLERVARRSETVARFGGDEFVLLLTELRSDEDLCAICERFLNALRQPLKIGKGMRLTGSLGVAACRDAKADPAELLQKADLAMYDAKRSGRDRIAIYDRQAHGLTASGRGLALDLGRAIGHDELFVLYQPLFRLSDGSLTGVEALVRWRHPTRGVLAPAEFIPLAERHGLISAVDMFALDAACGQLAAWIKADPAWKHRTMSVNVSGRALRDPNLVHAVMAVLRRHCVEPGQLCLEVTETALVGELEDANRVIQSLSEHGVRIALDDFGTGYSTLAHLQQLRADVLKIDRSFVAHIGRQSRDHEIIAAVTAMAHALGMSVVAEGVESALQSKRLRGLRCDAAQGYFLARPQPPEEIARRWPPTAEAA
jgi:diguanylate cyclase (GGDEF)-like protein/PAS domain S-box-containing protein